MLTQYTSFVAVEERVVTDGGRPRTIQVPVELPEGMNSENGFIIDGVDAKQIQSLPVNGRRFTQFSRLGASYGLTTPSVARINQLIYFDLRDPDKNKEAEITSQTVKIPADAEETTEKKSKSTKYKNLKTGDVAYIVSGKQEQQTSIIIKAANAPKPIYPANVKANGAVNVEVTLDADGKVVSAKAVAGNKSFYQMAETAAQNAKFEIPKLEFEIKRITGTIVYNFAKNKTATVAENLGNVRIEIKPNKYQSAVKSLVERLKNKTAETADEAKFVRGGKADLIVRVAELKPETIAALKNLGFEILTEMPSANAVVGKIAIEKIAALAELEAVTFISPQK